MLFGERIKQYRQDNNYSQRDLAGILNVNVRTVVRWEQDKTKPNQEDLKRISSLIGLTEEELLNDSEDSGTFSGKVKKQGCIEKISEGVDNLVSGQESLNESLLSNRDTLISELQNTNNRLLLKIDEQSKIIESYKKELDLSRMELRHKRIRTIAIVSVCLFAIVMLFITWLYWRNNGISGDPIEGTAGVGTPSYFEIDDGQ